MKKNLIFLIYLLLFFSCNKKGTIVKIDLDKVNQLFTDVSPADTNEYYTSISSGPNLDFYIGDNLGNIYIINDSTNSTQFLFNASKSGSAIYKVVQNLPNNYYIGIKNEGLKFFEENKKQAKKQYKIKIKNTPPFDGTQYSVYDFTFCEETGNWLVCTSNGFYSTNKYTDTLDLIYPDVATLLSRKLNDYPIRNIVVDKKTKSYYISTPTGVLYYNPLHKNTLLLNTTNIEHVFLDKDTLFALSDDSLFSFTLNNRIANRFPINKKRMFFRDNRSNCWIYSDKEIIIKRGSDSIVIMPSVDEKLSENPRNLTVLDSKNNAVFFISKDKIYKTYSYKNFYSSHEQNIIASAASDDKIYFLNDDEDLFELEINRVKSHPIFIGKLKLNSTQKVRNIFVSRGHIYAVTEQEIFSQPIPNRWNLFNKKAKLIYKYKDRDKLKIKSAYLLGSNLMIGGKFGLLKININKKANRKTTNLEQEYSAKSTKNIKIGTRPQLLLSSYNVESFFGNKDFAFIQTLEGKLFYYDGYHPVNNIEGKKFQTSKNYIYVNDSLFYMISNKNVTKKTLSKDILTNNILVKNIPYNLPGCIAVGDSLLYVGTQNGCLKINTKDTNKKEWLQFKYTWGISTIIYYFLLLFALPLFIIILLQRFFHFTILQKKSIIVNEESTHKRIKNIETLLEKFTPDSMEYNATIELSKKINNKQLEIKNNPDKIWDLQKFWDEISIEISKLNGKYNELCIEELKVNIIEQIKTLKEIKLKEGLLLIDHSNYALRKRNITLAEVEKIKNENEKFITRFKNYKTKYNQFQKDIQKISVKELTDSYIPLNDIEDYTTLAKQSEILDKYINLIEKLKRTSVDTRIITYINEKTSEITSTNEINANDLDLIIKQLNNSINEFVYSTLSNIRNVNEQIEQSKILSQIAWVSNVKYNEETIERYKIPQKIEKFFNCLSENDKKIILEINNSNDFQGHICKILPVILAVPKLEIKYLDRIIIGEGKGSKQRKSDLKNNILKFGEEKLAQLESAILWDRIYNLYFHSSKTID
ncbi:hypothetical protein TRIP_D310111 [uncultured Paludibacter sp.]|uniref:Uncharacterized protein n=1 Tax=uncultured Paludibacter sp. TaxID=497635 RepID=A0A653ACI0_9BACT|nr:hypothetical protein TRIP_D310111 [uncultured Paludibacter sp.]